jgi:hypothetical protein
VYANITKQRLSIVVLVAITLLVYANSFPGAYHFDDYALMLGNEKVMETEFDYSAFLEQYGGRPLTFWTFWLNFQLTGRDPATFHGFNLLLHICAVLALFLLIREWSKDPLLAFITALIFSIHPVQAQAVNYIWSRSMLLMGVFALFSLLLAKKQPTISLILFQLAIWSRFEALVLIIPLIILNSRKTWVLSILAALNLSLFLTGVYLYQPNEFAWYYSNPIQYWLNAAGAVWWYFIHLTWPSSFSIFRGSFSLETYLSAIAIAGLTLLMFSLWKYRHKQVIPVICVSWTLLLLAPSLIVPNSEIINESRSYLAFAGISCLWGYLLITFLRLIQNRFSIKNQIAVFIVLGVIIVVAVPATRARNRIWQESTLLWEEAVTQNPGHFHPYYNLGSAYARKGDLRAAEETFLKSSELNPGDDMSYAGLGYCCEMSQNWKCAAKWYRTALNLNPENSYASQGLDRVSQKLESKGS